MIVPSKWRLLVAFYILLCKSTVQTSGQLSESSHVKLSLDEFQELFSSARLKEAEMRLLDKQKQQEAEHKRKLEEVDKKIRTKDFESKKQREAMFPKNYQVLRHTAAGVFNASDPHAAGVEKDVVSFELEIFVRVMDPKWTAVDLVDTSSIVASNWEVYWKGNGDDEAKDFESVDAVTSPDAMLLLRENKEVLATNRTGLFKVKFNAYTRIRKNRNLNTMSLSSVLYPLSDFSLCIATDSTGGAIKDLSIQPPSSVLHVQQLEDQTLIKAIPPLGADSIQIRWLEVVEEEESNETATAAAPAESKSETIRDNTEARRQKQEISPDVSEVTSIHDALHTIEEGIIRSLHYLEFKTTSSTINSVQFVLHGCNVRITSIFGHGLQSWNVENSDEDSTPNLCFKLVKVTFKSSQLETEVLLKILTEKDRQKSSGGDVELPRIECKKVIRQTGHVAVVKDANVEIHEQKITGLSRCEPSELPSQLRLNVDRPIMFSYKYLSAHDNNNVLLLNVKEHEAIDTLDAAVDRLHYKAIVMDTHTVHSILVILQTTKLQYLKLEGLPSSSSMFTLLVNSVPAKPVKVDEGDAYDPSVLLIPLLIGLDPEMANNEGGSMKTSIELNYVSKHDSLGHNGTLHLSPPRVELPISVLTTHLRLPQTFDYQFSGHFGTAPSDKLTHVIPAVFSSHYATGKRVVDQDHKFSRVDDLWPEDSSEKKGGGGIQMVVPPSTGRSFYFYKLFVVGDALDLNVDYAVPPPAKKLPWWQQLFGFQ